MRFFYSALLLIVLQCSVVRAETDISCEVPSTAGIEELIPLLDETVEPLPEGVIEPLFDNLGDYEHPIATDGENAESAQQYFDQGLRLWYAFNMPESLHSFAQAAKLSPEASMPYWGIALAAGPDVNYPNIPCRSLKLGYTAADVAVHKAKVRATAAGVTNHEIDQLASALESGEFVEVQTALHHYRHDPVAMQAIAELGCALAIAQRYLCEPTPCAKCGLDAKYRVTDEESLAFTRAMGVCHQLFSDDSDIAVLYAFSLMQLHPWQWWSNEKTPTPQITIAIDLLENVLSNAPNHPGANHFYIHAVEEGPISWIEKSLASALRMPELIPGAGHFQHMPSHVYRNLGYYDLATLANKHAVAADREYIEDVAQFHPVARYPLHYLGHNLHFLVTTQIAQGKQSEAFASSRELMYLVREFARGFNAEHNPVHVNNEAGRFLTVPLTVSLQFEFDQWDEVVQSVREVQRDVSKVLSEVEAESPELPVVSTMLEYGNTLYAIQQRDWTKAIANAGEFKRLAKTTDASFQTNSAEDVFQIASYIILARAAQAIEEPLDRAYLTEMGEVLGLKVDRDTAPEMVGVEALTSAITLQDNLFYNDPPEWYFPVRQALGAMYYRQQEMTEAENTFREDLEINPGDPRSTYGLIMSLRQQGKPVDPALEAHFNRTWSNELPPSMDSM